MGLFNDFCPVTYVVICNCIYKWRNMPCICEKRVSSTFYFWLGPQESPKLSSPLWVLILPCSIHCIILVDGLFSGNVLTLVTDHEMPYTVKLHTFIILWEAAGEILKPVGCACDSFCCGGRDLLSSWLAGATRVLQVSCPRCII